VIHAKTRRLLRTGAERWAAALVLLVACGPCGATEPPDTDREDHLRAGYLLNFAKFVEWPALGATDVLTVCFVGGTGIRESFAIGAGGKLAGNHPFATRALTGRESTEGCQVLYVEAAAPFSREYTGVAVSPALLTVGDAHDFIHKGGIVELFADSNRLRFNINLDNARRAGLRISSSLLQLASRVEGTGQ
jgi:YfiR/HmsC-like